MPFQRVTRFGAPPWRVAEAPSLRGFVVEWLSADRVLLARRNVLYEAPAIGASLRRAGVVPQPWWRVAGSRVRIVQRALRQMFYNVLPLPDGSLFVTYARDVGSLRGGVWRPLPGLVRPCRVLRGGAALDPDGHVYFGEYLPNADRGAIRVYRCVPGAGALDVVHTFAPGAVRHVHGSTATPPTPACGA